MPLDGSALTWILATQPRGMGDASYRHAGGVYRTHLVPWLPGEDHTTDLSSYESPRAPEETATPWPSYEDLLWHSLTPTSAPSPTMPPATKPPGSEWRPYTAT